LPGASLDELLEASFSSLSPIFSIRGALGYLLNSGLLIAEEGTHNIIIVALLLKDGPTGTFFYEGVQASFV
jgi:hypothetical protein